MENWFTKCIFTVWLLLLIVGYSSALPKDIFDTRLEEFRFRQDQFEFDYCGRADHLQTLWPDFNNPFRFIQCRGFRLIGIHNCPAPLMFGFSQQVCVWERDWRAPPPPSDIMPFPPTVWPPINDNCPPVGICPPGCPPCPPPASPTTQAPWPQPPQLPPTPPSVGPTFPTLAPPGEPPLVPQPPDAIPTPPNAGPTFPTFPTFAPPGNPVPQPPNAPDQPDWQVPNPPQVPNFPDPTNAPTLPPAGGAPTFPTFPSFAW